MPHQNLTPDIEARRTALRDKIAENYEKWITSVEAKYPPIDLDSLQYQPKISVIVPVYNVLDRHLIPCIESVLAQDYPNWELCISDDHSSWENVRHTLAKYENHPKIKIHYRKENGHISENTNDAIALATGEFLAFMDCDDTLASFALSEVVSRLNESPDLDFIYSDEDKIDDDGKNRHFPHFKSDWAPDTLLSHMYTSHLGVYRTSLVRQLGGLRKGYEGAQDYDLTLRVTEETDKIAHISKILYHWREREESTAASSDAKDYIVEATRRSKQDAIIRRGLQAELEPLPWGGQCNVRYCWDSYPKVSVIIPSKDNYDVLKRCLDSLFEKTQYSDYEIVLVDNGSSDKTRKKYEQLLHSCGGQYIYEKSEFNFSAMCNLGAHHATGDYYLFLNDDTEIMQGDWLARMVGQAMLSYTGAVGAKLLYPDRKTIQHTGIIMIEPGPVHAMVCQRDRDPLPFFRNVSNYNYSAVTGACLLVDAKKYHEVGEFEESLPVAYNDVDLCLKLVEVGYYNVVRNDVMLIHHESVSRGDDAKSKKKMQRLDAERAKLYKRHPRFEASDPFYNKNLTQHRTDFSCDYEITNDAFYCKVEKLEDIEQISSCSIRYRWKFCYAFDEADCDMHAITIRGWIFVKGVPESDLWDAEVILRNSKTKECYLCATKKKQRLDVMHQMQKYGEMEFSGFECRIARDDLPDGVYEIYLKLGDYGIKKRKKLYIGGNSNQ